MNQRDSGTEVAAPPASARSTKPAGDRRDVGHRDAAPPQRVAGGERQIAGADRRQRGVHGGAEREAADREHDRRRHRERRTESSPATIGRLRRAGSSRSSSRSCTSLSR